MAVYNGKRLFTFIPGNQEVITKITTEEEMNELLNNATPSDDGKMYKYIGESGTFENGAYYVLKYSEE